MLVIMHKLLKKARPKRNLIKAGVEVTELGYEEKVEVKEICE